MPRVSVIMGAYNDALRLDAAVQSILGQSFGDLEFIICDDGSTDDTAARLAAWAARDARVRVLRNAENRTLAPTLNRCIAAAQGEYIARMDADDVAHPDRLLRQVAHLDAHPEHAVVGCSVRLFDEAGFWGVRDTIEKPVAESFLRGNCFAHPTCVFRREVLGALGGYATGRDRERVEDFDLFLRLYAAGYCGYNLPEPLLDYYESRRSRGRREYRFRVNNARVRFAGYRSLGLLPRGLLYCAKPLLLGLLPYEAVLWHHRRTARRETQ